MSGLQQLSRHLFDPGMYLESMKISRTTRAGTVVANHACARRWLLTAPPPKRSAKSVTEPRNGDPSRSSCAVCVTAKRQSGSEENKMAALRQIAFYGKGG